VRTAYDQFSAVIPTLRTICANFCDSPATNDRNSSPGTILDFNAPQDEAALFGGVMAAAVQRSLGGIVADGPVRDPGES